MVRTDDTPKEKGQTVFIVRNTYLKKGIDVRRVLEDDIYKRAENKLN